MKLTKRTADAVVPDRVRDIYVWDNEVRGFGLRVKPSGVRSFIVQYRNASGISRRVTVGKLGVLTPEEAHKSAKRILADVTHGHDPAAKRSDDRKAMTVRQLCRAYLDAASKGLVLGKRNQPKRPSTLYIDRGRIERHILPLLGNRVLRDLRSETQRLKTQLLFSPSSCWPSQVAGAGKLCGCDGLRLTLRAGACA